MVPCWGTVALVGHPHVPSTTWRHRAWWCERCCRAGCSSASSCSRCRAIALDAAPDGEEAVLATVRASGPPGIRVDELPSESSRAMLLRTLRALESDGRVRLEWRLLPPQARPREQRWASLTETGRSRGHAARSMVNVSRGRRSVRDRRRCSPRLPNLVMPVPKRLPTWRTSTALRRSVASLQARLARTGDARRGTPAIWLAGLNRVAAAGPPRAD